MRICLLHNIVVITTTLLCAAAHSTSAEIQGNLALLPVLVESSDKGILVDLIKAMQKAYPEANLKYTTLPFKRSIDEVIAGRADFHAPILKDPTKTKEQLGFAYSDANVWDVIFALYTHRGNKEITVKNLSQFNIETDAAHVSFFDFPIKPSTCLECSLKKVDAGRIDGFIFAAMESDNIVKTLKLKNIKSTAYKTYEGKFVLPLGERAKITNKILSEMIERTKKNGDYQKTVGVVTDYYKNWQPLH